MHGSKLTIAFTVFAAVAQSHSYTKNDDVATDVVASYQHGADATPAQQDNEATVEAPVDYSYNNVDGGAGHEVVDQLTPCPSSTTYEAMDYEGSTDGNNAHEGTESISDQAYDKTTYADDKAVTATTYLKTGSSSTLSLSIFVSGIAILAMLQ